MPIWIEEVRWASHQDVLQSIRQAVFIIEQGIDPVDEWDHRDATCRHFLGYLDHTPVGCARLLDGRTIGRMAVLNSARGQHVGSRLLLACLTAIRATQATAVLGAQISAMPFYALHGFQPDGPIFDDAGIPHRRMTLETQFPYQIRPLTRTPVALTIQLSGPTASIPLTFQTETRHWQLRLPVMDTHAESWLTPRLIYLAECFQANRLTLFTPAGPVQVAFDGSACC
jgi:predicted GNAT family N-acyltransferase